MPCRDILDINLQHNFKAVYLLQQCCLPNIRTTMDERHINNTVDSYKDICEYFRQHHPATYLQGCLLAAALLFVKYFNNNE